MVSEFIFFGFSHFIKLVESVLLNSLHDLLVIHLSIFLTWYRTRKLSNLYKDTIISVRDMQAAYNE